jgi:hypothetical protein
VDPRVSSIIIQNGDWFWPSASSNAWDLLRYRQPVVSWWRLIWLPKAIPKHAFCLWLAFRDALPTKERLSLGVRR